MLCACNDKYIRLWPSKNKSQNALDTIGFLPKFKDGTKLYNKYGCFLSQCILHIQKYLKGIYDFIDHKAPKKLSEFFTKCNNSRNRYIEKNIMSFSDEEYSFIIKEYDNIIDEWEKELRDDANNYLFNEESKLFFRLKYGSKKADNKETKRCFF